MSKKTNSQILSIKDQLATIINKDKTELLNLLQIVETSLKFHLDNPYWFLANKGLSILQHILRTIPKPDLSYLYEKVEQVNKGYKVLECEMYSLGFYDRSTKKRKPASEIKDILKRRSKTEPIKFKATIKNPNDVRVDFYPKKKEKSKWATSNSGKSTEEKTHGKGETKSKKNLESNTNT